MMARQPRAEQAPQGEQDAEQAPQAFVLARNHGMVVHGRSHFYPAGLDLDADKDAELISALVRSGASFK